MPVYLHSPKAPFSPPTFWKPHLFGQESSVLPLINHSFVHMYWDSNPVECWRVGFDLFFISGNFSARKFLQLVCKLFSGGRVSLNFWQGQFFFKLLRDNLSLTFCRVCSFSFNFLQGRFLRGNFSQTFCRGAVFSFFAGVSVGWWWMYYLHSASIHCCCDPLVDENSICFVHLSETSCCVW